MADDSCGVGAMALALAPSYLLATSGLAQLDGCSYPELVAQLYLLARIAILAWPPRVTAGSRGSTVVRLAGGLTWPARSLATRPGALPRARTRFSIAKLLAVVAFVAGLLSACVPLFQTNLWEPPRLNARMDLDMLRNALHLYESRIAPLRGNDLTQIVGKTIQDLPVDPWGAPYLLDTASGTIRTLGADARPGGSEDDEDLILRYRNPEGAT